ncbi:MAG: hypothetical protein ACR2RD_10145 [Woeseiaceae bacterium]
MNDELKRTTKIVQKPKVRTDDRGRTVWDDTIKTANLELVSTQMLQQLMDSDDEATTNRLQEVSKGEDGVLAHDADKGRFEIISDEELQHILDGTDAEYNAKRAAAIEVPLVESVAEDEEELELVSTQMLRQILSPEDFIELDDDDPAASGFDPYNHT